MPRAPPSVLVPAWAGRCPRPIRALETRRNTPRAHDPPEGISVAPTGCRGASDNDAAMPDSRSAQRTLPAVRGAWRGERCAGPWSAPTEYGRADDDGAPRGLGPPQTPRPYHSRDRGAHAAGGAAPRGGDDPRHCAGEG